LGEGTGRSPVIDLCGFAQRHDSDAFGSFNSPIAEEVGVDFVPLLILMVFVPNSTDGGSVLRDFCATVCP